MIDATEQQVRFFSKNFVNGQFHAIDWCARGLPGGLHAFDTESNLLHLEDAVDGNGMTHATLSTIGCNHYNISVVDHSFCKGLYSFSLDTVIVGDEDEWA